MNHRLGFHQSRILAFTSMSTTGAPELTWVDLDDDLERFLIEAQEDWNRLFPSTSTAGAIPTNQKWLWPGDSSNLSDPDLFVPPGTFDRGLAPAPQFISQTGHEFQMLAPGITPRPTSAQGSGASASLAPAKPEIIENDIHSESSRSTPSSSRGKYNRAENEEGKRSRLSHIREALGISSTEDELPTLQKLIQHLGGTVPEHETSHGWLTKPRRQAKKRAELRECFRELRNIVSPRNARLGDLKVLTLAWELVTSQVVGQRGSEGEYQQYGVFRVR
ncbi:hypothetical protein BJ322DRAFT_527174 [Thelephora terrestris]|uniref:BHLH domain-containing protein n=1 Tax=Thelephora terrestris TaxID=56493 RepID=A0A9P6HKC8_9AGAM|nr:hypothetical protein BJ322DRAFT_527174 [Thelephora terrestris]